MVGMKTSPVGQAADGVADWNRLVLGAGELLGLTEGSKLGKLDGTCEGEKVGSDDGDELGWPLGSDDGE